MVKPVCCFSIKVARYITQNVQPPTFNDNPVLTNTDNRGINVGPNLFIKGYSYLLKGSLEDTSFLKKK